MFVRLKVKLIKLSNMIISGVENHLISQVKARFASTFLITKNLTIFTLILYLY